MLFDTHTHMDDKAFDADREALLESFPTHGVGLLMNPGCSWASSVAAAELAKKYDEPETVPFINGILGSFLKGEAIQE